MSDHDAEHTREILRKVRQIEIRSNRLVAELFAGSYHSAFKGQGIDFEEVREYQPGDEVRTIDWNVTAREGFPFVKQYKEERELTIVLAVDISKSNQYCSSYESKREKLAELAALVAFSASRTGIKLGFYYFLIKLNSTFRLPKGTNMLCASSERFYLDLHREKAPTSTELFRNLIKLPVEGLSYSYYQTSL